MPTGIYDHSMRIQTHCVNGHLYDGHNGKQNTCSKCASKFKRGYQLKRRYGITLEQYDELLTKQKGRCALCGHFPEGRPLDVDHDHINGIVRGLLCNRCNSALGALGDNEEGMERALEYIRRTAHSSL